MALIPSFIYPMSLLLCLAMLAGALAVPAEPQQQRKDRLIPTMLPVPTSVSYTEATPSHDFTLANVPSTIEEILAKAGVQQDDETRYCKYCLYQHSKKLTTT